MKTLQGKASGAFAPFVGEVTFAGRPFHARSGAVLVTDRLGVSSLGYRGCIVSGEGRKGSWFPHHVHAVGDVSCLHEGDIVGLDDSGRIRVLWEEGSAQNCLFLTERCNCRCVMCPQPPARSDSQPFLREAGEVLNLLRGKRLSDCCLTGGEPTLAGEDFFRLLRRAAREHPEALVSVLTNGRLFADRDFAGKLAGVPARNVLFCVSLHSEIDTVHDGMTGVRGSCAQTQQGLYRLASMGFSVEIRTVITRCNYRYLPSLAEHIGNYFPFCAHCVFMGLEMHGHAAEHAAQLDVAPPQFAPYLKEAVRTLERRGVPVSVYNVPLCLCPEEVRPRACRSISAWKNVYLPPCFSCVEKERCCGFFSTSATLPEAFVKPFTEGE